VLVREEVVASAPAFEEIREGVQRDLVSFRGEQALTTYVALLRKKYDIKIRARLGSDLGE
jgi:hypothetical protein